MIRLTTLIATATIPILAGALAQGPAQKQALLMSMTANAKQVTQFQWKQRITVIRKGAAMEPTIQEVRFDASGQPVPTVLVKPEERKMGPLRARKAAEIKESVQETMRLAFRYLSPQQLGAAIQNGEIWQGPSAIRVRARAVVLPADDVEIAVNPMTFLPVSVDVKTSHEGNPVSVVIAYEPLPNGPSAMRRMTVQMPAEGIVIQVESFDFARLAGPIIH